MVSSSGESQSLSEAERRYAQPYYLSFLHGNYTSFEDAERSEFKAAVTKAAREVETEELVELLEIGDWRPRIAAAYLIGIGRRADLLPLVARALVEQRYRYATQGQVFALARLASVEARVALEAYAAGRQDDGDERGRARAALSLLRGEPSSDLPEDIAGLRSQLEAELRFWD